MAALAELDFGHTVAADALSALFTAVLVGLAAGLVVSWFGARHDELQQGRSLEHQTRAALRETYAQLLVAQRRSRQASLELARSGGSLGRRHRRSGRTSDELHIGELAESAHSEFIDFYHRLNLDASEEMWRDARALRHVLDDMLDSGREGNAEKCERLMKLARSARQNLERSFRIRLKNKPLQSHRDLGKYDKGKA
jgi:hypothetical protein